jgi:hypothetical protein
MGGRKMWKWVMKMLSKLCPWIDGVGEDPDDKQEQPEDLPDARLSRCAYSLDEIRMYAYSKWT